MSNKKRRKTKLGTFMSKILRHAPIEFGVNMDDYGFCEIDDLLLAINSQEFWSHVTMDDIKNVVVTCPKQRYTITGSRIKANYGHSFPVIIPDSDRTPPSFIFHGTSFYSLEPIIDNNEGILPMNRENVHLSETKEFATLAAKRKNKPKLLMIDTAKLIHSGQKLQYAGNEVWLCKHVPANCIFSILDI